MPNIVLTKIDNRLVHGQIGVSWVGFCGCNLIVVADDEVANDPIQQSLMKMTADSTSTGIRFFSLEKTIDIIHKASEAQKIFIVVKTPASARKLVEGGVPIKTIIIGNMHHSPGKRLGPEAHVYVDDKDMEDFNAIKAAGVELYIQIAPGDRKFDI